MASLFDRLDKDYAPPWRPQPGDKVVGVVTDLTVRDGEYGRYPIVTLRAEGEGYDGEVAVHAFHEVLANELARIAPKVGDTIGIKYDGWNADAGYHRYRVRSKANAGFDWSRFGDSDGGAADMLRAEAPAETARPGDPESSAGAPDADDVPF